LTDFGENEIGRDSDDEHYHEHHQENKEPKKDDSLTLGHKETHAVHAGKCLVFVVLILTAMTMAILMYWFTKQEEWKTFKTEFQSIAMQLLNTYGQSQCRTYYQHCAQSFYGSHVLCQAGPFTKMALCDHSQF